MPSVRGRTKLAVAGTLAGAATLTGGLAGFAAGIVALVASVGPMRSAGAVAIVALAGLLDHAFTPPSIRLQVPQLWGRVLGPGTAAVLYGARLGPGPLTILNSWLWWAALAIGATTGPWGAASVGASFGAVRVMAMLVVGTRAGALARSDRLTRSAIAVAAVVLAVGAASVAADPASQPRRASVPASAAAPAGPASRPTTVGTHPLPAAGAAVADASLASRLPVHGGDGFVPLEDDLTRGLGPLDLRRAAALEHDEPAERALLETRGFEAGHARGWRHHDGRSAYAAVYRFPSAAAAEAYRTDGTITLEGRGVRQVELERPAGALAFQQVLERTDGARVARAVALVRGRHFALVIVTGRSSTPSAGDAEGLAVAVADLMDRQG